MNKIIAFILILMLTACASSPQIAIDPKSITDTDKYENDMEECKSIAKSYDLSEGVAKSAVVGAAAGGAAVAGIATIVAGAIFWPAVPFIVAGTVATGTAAGSTTKLKEKEAREKILAECMAERGYKVYAPK